MADLDEWDERQVLAEIGAALRAYEELGLVYELLSAARWLRILIHVKHPPVGEACPRWADQGRRDLSRRHSGHKATTSPMERPRPSTGPGWGRIWRRFSWNPHPELVEGRGFLPPSRKPTNSGLPDRTAVARGPGWRWY